MFLKSFFATIVFPDRHHKPLRSRVFLGHKDGELDGLIPLAFKNSLNNSVFEFAVSSHPYDKRCVRACARVPTPPPRHTHT